MKQTHHVLHILILATFLLAACGGSQPKFAGASVIDTLNGGIDEGYARATEPYPFVFPSDHGAHPAFKTEWWYYTGNLDATDGRQYGYQLTFFRSALSPESSERDSSLATNQVYLGHLAVTDVAAQEHMSFERYSRGDGSLAGATGDPLYEVWLESWRASEDAAGVITLEAMGQGEEGPTGISLTLRETIDPLLHGNAGLSQKGPEVGNANYYYSLIGLESSGSVTFAGETVDVTGKSWMDHEFGTSALSGDAVGWDWFSVQLENDAALMFAQVRTRSGGTVDNFEGTLLLPTGERLKLGSDDFSLEATGEWTSPHTDITYPAGWRVEIPAHAISLEIEPLVADQEMLVSFVYWEGAVSIRGEMAGDPVAGVGYVELTGYADASEYQR